VFSISSVRGALGESRRYFVVVVSLSMTTFAPSFSLRLIAL
jgi:hypothetical protein